MGGILLDIFMDRVSCPGKKGNLFELAVRENKHELWEMMEQRSMAPLTTDSVSDLAVLMGAYNAVCMVIPAKSMLPSSSIAPSWASIGWAAYCWIFLWIA
mgnify:CR=1 FL=1